MTQKWSSSRLCPALQRPHNSLSRSNLKKKKKTILNQLATISISLAAHLTKLEGVQDCLTRLYISWDKVNHAFGRLHKCIYDGRSVQIHNAANMGCIICAIYAYLSASISIASALLLKCTETILSITRLASTHMWPRLC